MHVPLPQQRGSMVMPNSSYFQLTKSAPCGEGLPAYAEKPRKHIPAIAVPL